MTLLEKFREEHRSISDSIEYDVNGYPHFCPWAYYTEDYAQKPSFCGHGSGYEECKKCWEREIPEEKTLNDVIEEACALNPELNKEEMQKSVHALIDDFGNKPHILDSGSKTEFTTGAVRDSREGKGRCDLLPLDVVCQYYYDIGLDIAFSIFERIGHFEASGNPVHLLEALKYFCEDRWDKDCNSMFLETSKQYAEGAEKYGENNWKNGMPVKIYIDSAVRHYLKFLRGDKDEPHDRAICWNLMCAIWTCKHKPELNDYAKRDISEVEQTLG